MKCRLALSAALLLVAFGTGLQAAADTLCELSVGPLPAPRPLNYEEHEAFTRLVNLDVIKRLPENAQDPAPVEVADLVGEAAAKVLQDFGPTLQRVPQPSGMLTAVAPTYPKALREAGTPASAQCLFEVRPDGAVGRIFSTGYTHRAFLVECGRALQQWRFPAAPATRRYLVMFVARP